MNMNMFDAGHQLLFPKHATCELWTGCQIISYPWKNYPHTFKLSVAEALLFDNFMSNCQPQVVGQSWLNPFLVEPNSIPWCAFFVFRERPKLKVWWLIPFAYCALQSRIDSELFAWQTAWWEIDDGCGWDCVDLQAGHWKRNGWKSTRPSVCGRFLPFHLPNLAGTFHSKPCTKYGGEKNAARSLDGLTWPAV